MSDALIPIIFTLAVMGVFLGFFHYSNKTKRSLHTALEKALEKGEKLTPELLNTLQTPQRGKFGDLRKGILWLAVGAALAMVGILNPVEHEHLAAYFSLFPIFIGLGYIVIWKLSPENGNGK